MIKYNNFINEGFYYEGGGNIRPERGDIVIVTSTEYPGIGSLNPSPISYEFLGKVGKIIQMFTLEALVQFPNIFSDKQGEALNLDPTGRSKWILISNIEKVDPEEIKRQKEFVKAIKVNDPYNEEIWDMNESKQYDKGDTVYFTSQFTILAKHEGKNKVMDTLEDEDGTMWYHLKNEDGEEVKWINGEHVFSTYKEYDKEKKRLALEKKKGQNKANRRLERIKKLKEEMKGIDPYEEEKWEEDINERKIQYKKELCPDLWDDMVLNERISTKLLKLAKDFFKDIELETEILDIHLTGSMVNYNYNAESDIDVHIEIDFADINDDVVLVKKAVDGQRFIWNMRHYITIRGHNVELYVIDKREEHISGGLYSLLNGEWIKKPKYAPPDVDTEDIDVKYDARVTDIMKFEEVSKSDISANEAEEYYENAKDLKSKIMKARKAGLSDKGEFSIENLVFKKLRRTGKFKKLLDTISRLYDKIFSQE